MYRLQVISYAWEHHLFVNSSSSNHYDGIRLLGGIVAEKNPSLVLSQWSSVILQRREKRLCMFETDAIMVV